MPLRAHTIRTLVNCAAVVWLVPVIGCSNGSSDVTSNVNDNASDPATNVNENDNGSVPEPDPRQTSLVYIENAEDVDLEALGAEAFDWVIIDTTRGGSEEDEFAPTEVRSLKENRPSCTAGQTLAYLNIGEARSNRAWFDVVWITGANGFIGYPTPGVAPSWLGDWDFGLPGNYSVRFWAEDWQAIIAGDPDGPDDSPVDRILDAGFDGLCLDGIASFDYWSDRPFGSELSRAEGRAVMIEWVQTIADYARAVRGDDFVVLVQNGLDIILDANGEVDALGDAYLDVIDGVVVENLYSDGGTPRVESAVDADLVMLDVYGQRALTVFVVEYLVTTASFPGLDEPQVEDLYTRSMAAGHVPYAADADMSASEPIVLDPSIWPVTQPEACDEETPAPAE